MSAATKPIPKRIRPPVESNEFDDKRAVARARRGGLENGKSVRKRLVDPATTDRQYTDDECEFLRAMDDYIRESGRKFPTWTEALGVLRSLGYVKSVAPSEFPRKL